MASLDDDSQTGAAGGDLVAARRHISDYTHNCGVDPGRILVAPRVQQQAHLERLSCCDLMLDPWPCGGHTTTADALFAGVPVIALEGGSFAGRVSSALLRAAGMRALVHTEVSAYVEMAVKLLHHPRELARIKQWVRSQAPQSEIFNTASKARQLEGAYAHLYERARQGLPPEHVNIQAQQKVLAGRSPSPQGGGVPASGGIATPPRDRFT